MLPSKERVPDDFRALVDCESAVSESVGAAAVDRSMEIVSTEIFSVTFNLVLSFFDVLGP
jgi:hypothetical protein